MKKATRDTMLSRPARTLLAIGILALFGGFAAWLAVHDDAPRPTVRIPGTVAEAAPTAPDTSLVKTEPAESGTGTSAPEKAPSPEGKQPFSWDPLIARLVAEGFDEARLRKTFSDLNSPPLPEFMGQKAIELYGRYGKASLAVSDADKLKFAPPDYTRIAGGMTAAAGRRLMINNAKFYGSSG